MRGAAERRRVHVRVLLGSVVVTVGYLLLVVQDGAVGGVVRLLHVARGATGTPPVRASLGGVLLSILRPAGSGALVVIEVPSARQGVPLLRASRSVRGVLQGIMVGAAVRCVWAVAGLVVSARAPRRHSCSPRIVEPSTAPAGVAIDWVSCCPSSRASVV